MIRTSSVVTYHHYLKFQIISKSRQRHATLNFMCGVHDDLINLVVSPSWQTKRDFMSIYFIILNSYDILRGLLHLHNNECNNRQ